MVYAKDSIWMGKWYVRGKPVKRSLGPMRQPGSREGMTKTQAEANGKYRFSLFAVFSESFIQRFDPTK